MAKDMDVIKLVDCLRCEFMSENAVLKNYTQLSFFILIIFLTGCGGESITQENNGALSDDGIVIVDDGLGDHVNDGSTLITSEFTGSVGDGPIVGATLNFYDNSGNLIKTEVSDDTARYSTRIRAKGNVYPLTIEVVGGIDLVTDRAPDFKMVSVVDHPSTKEVNVNPFSTLIVKSAASMPGGLVKENIDLAKTNVEKYMNFGLSPTFVPDAIKTEINESNVGVIVKSSETLGEMIRRASKLLIASSSVANEDQLVQAIAEDISDGVLDGVGGGNTNHRIAAVSNIVSAQVLVESLSNTLKVDDEVATSKMDDAILTITPQSSVSSLTDSVRINAEQLEQTIVALKASYALRNRTKLVTAVDALAAVSAGSLPNEIEVMLPEGIDTELDIIVETVKLATDEELSQVVTAAKEAVNELNGQMNNAPVISGDPEKTILEDTFYEFLPEATDADGDALSFSVQNLPSWMGFNSKTGRIYGTPINEDVGTYQNIIITVSDGSASASTEAFSIEVTNVNDGPSISGNPPTSIEVGSLYEFLPSVLDVDDEALTFDISNLPRWANFNVQNGFISGTPNETDVGQYNNITISVTDGQISSYLNAFSITVSSSSITNSLPVISGSPNVTVNENSSYSFQPYASDADNDSLMFNIVNKPSWASFNTSNGSLAGTPTSNDVGVHGNISISVSDGIGSSYLESFSITVIETNSAPSIGGVPLARVNQNTFYSFQPIVNDPDDDVLSFFIVNKPTWAEFSSSTGELSGTPLNSDVGTVSNIVVSVTDGQENVPLPAFSITVVDENNTPTISGEPITALYENAAYSFTPNANDIDGDMLTFSIINKPAWATFDTSTGALNGTPASSDIGVTSDIIISVTDGFTDPVALLAFSINVESRSATLSWTAPTTNSDGSPLPFSDIGGYKIYTGTDANNLSLLVNIDDSSITEYIITNLSPATHYYSVSAYNLSGIEGEGSSVVSKTINSL